MEHITLEELRELLREAEQLKSKLGRLFYSDHVDARYLDNIISPIEKELRKREEQILDTVGLKVV